VSPTPRRTFLFQAAGLGAGLALSGKLRAAESAANKLVVGIMGCSNNFKGDGRGMELAKELVKLPNAEIAYVCDVDARSREGCAAAVEKLGGKSPKAVGDFRRILDDRAVDALVIAAPDHWHAPATLLACAAGKHVYVEKPASHNAAEGELMVSAARKHQKVVQLGTQRRSWPAIREAVEKVRSGAIGSVKLARTWYFNARPSIGHGQQTSPPDWLDWELWQGPAPERPYQDNLTPYNWHWFWHWGTGELCNNGVHMIDVCRWGLGVDYPRSVSSIGGKYAHDDDNETPDTNTATFDFGDRAITWECRNWSRQTKLDPQCEVAFFGDQGTLAIDGDGYAIQDLEGKELSRNKAEGGTGIHLQNFLRAVRGDEPPHAEIEEGHKSTLLCHLGNIAYRLGRTVRTDPATGRLAGDAEAGRLWSREYRPGWEPRV
jgi:predicted dehydrogenase